MSVGNTAGARHPISLAFLDAVTQTADGGYQFDPNALPALQKRLRALCSDRAGLLDGIFSLLDLANLLRSHRSPRAAAQVVHLVVTCCGHTLRQMGAAGDAVLSGFEPARPPDTRRMRDFLGLESAPKKSKTAAAPGSISGPLARHATASDPSSSRRPKNRP